MPVQNNQGKVMMWDPSNILVVPAGDLVQKEPTVDDLVAYSGLRMVPTKNIDYFEDRDEEFRRKRFNVDEKHLIPYIPSKSVVLTNAGKVASGAKISTNVLDSLAKYGALAGVSPVDALGIPTRETSLGLYPGQFLFSPNPFLPEEHTFHGQNKLVDEGVVSPAEIINNDMFYVSPYNHAIAWAGRTVGGVSKAGDSRVRYERNPVTDSDMDAALAKSRAYSDRLAGKINMNEHPLLHGFRLFREKKFNRGELGYEDHIRSDGEAVFNSPEVQKWWISEGKNWYNGTRFEKNPLLKTVFVGEPGYELAEGGKIHIRPENKGKFTALLKRTGKSASWFKEHGTPLQKKRATFALNSRKWGNRKGEGGENLIAEYPEGYNGELRQGKSFNAWDRYLSNHPMVGHRLRKAKTLLLDVARVHPLTSFATDVYDSYVGPQDESDKITTPLGVVGRGGDIILNTVKQAGEIEPNMKKVFGNSAFGRLVSLPDFIDDSLKFVRDFAEPVTSFENGGYLLGHVYDLSEEQVNELIRQGYEVERV